jgi:hypothetical protein
MKRSLAVAVALAAASVAAQASSPKFFQAATQADFLKGDLENLSIDNAGQLVLGPATDLVYETTAPFLWALTPGPDGSLFIGTGNEGEILRVDPRGNGSRFFDSTELEVHALTPAPDGGLYAASSPDGKIYKVDPNGTATTFFDPEDKYIWALASDSKGNLFAATGQKGSVYRISPDGKGELFYESKAMHVTALAVDKDGTVFIGTESPGRVLRVDHDGKAFLLLDSPFQEIRAFRFDDKGNLYVAALNGRATSGGGIPAPVDTPPPERTGGDTARPPIPVVTTEVTSVAVVDTPSGPGGSTSSGPDRGSAKGAIYRIAPDGLWDEVWQSRDDSPYDLVFDGQGRLIVGTGSKGRIFRLEGEPPQPTLLTRAAGEQVTALYKDSMGRVYYTTANPGKLYRLSSQLAAEGSYESEPRDAQIVATWGSISWRGSSSNGGRIEVSTRSGNTAVPDETWSSWSAPYSNAQGSQIVSPKARYLQWRATLRGNAQSPVLTSVNAAYLQRNVRPEVRSVTVHPPGIVYQKPFSTGDPDLAGFENQTTPDRRLTNAAMSPTASASSSPALGRRTYEKGLQTLVWRADDENGDDLTYEVDYRREGDSAWRVLRRDVIDPILVWDTTTVPNGTYVVKIIASDSPSNADDLRLTGELVSTAFEIDNAPPAITVQGVRADGGRTVVSFDVTDDHSPIQRVECSDDGQLWRSVFPRDGIADSKSERYEITLPAPLGPRGLSIRATDAMNNVATTQIDANGRR